LKTTSSETEILCPKCGAHYGRTETCCPYCGYIYEKGAEKAFFRELEKTREQLDKVELLKTEAAKIC